MITRTDVAAQLERGVRANFLTAMKTYTPMRAPFTSDVPSDGAFEIYANMGELPWPRQVNGQNGSGGTDDRTSLPVTGGLHAGGPVTVVGGEERGILVYNDGWEITIGIYHDAINDNRVGNLETWARSAAQRFEQHKDYLAFAALNGGDGTTYGTCFDGLSLFNDSHVYPRAEYATAQDNSYALALSLDNFETVRVAGSGMLDSRGQPLKLVHNLLVHSINLERTAAQIVDNKEAYDTASREMNPYAGKTRGLMAPGGWVDSTFWCLVDDTLESKPIILQMREGPNLNVWDDHTQGGGIRYYKIYARYAVAYGYWPSAIMGNS